jgi:hypothetical protein
VAITLSGALKCRVAIVDLDLDLELERSEPLSNKENRP